MPDIYICNLNSLKVHQCFVGRCGILNTSLHRSLLMAKLLIAGLFFHPHLVVNCASPAGDCWVTNNQVCYAVIQVKNFLITHVLEDGRH
jgi:hypothetical protein